MKRNSLIKNSLVFVRKPLITFMISISKGVSVLTQYDKTKIYNKKLSKYVTNHYNFYDLLKKVIDNS